MMFEIVVTRKSPETHADELEWLLNEGWHIGSTTVVASGEQLVFVTRCVCDEKNSALTPRRLANRTWPN